MQNHFSPGMAAYLELAVEITCLSTMRVKWFFAYHSRHTDSSKIHLKTDYRRGHAFEREGLRLISYILTQSRRLPTNSALEWSSGNDPVA